MGAAASTDVNQKIMDASEDDMKATFGDDMSLEARDTLIAAASGDSPASSSEVVFKVQTAEGFKEVVGLDALQAHFASLK
mmetsp:Transcript_17911/g.45804  ORF Transcript_17911/g.45804 Transcript_17911/m.45804 type:complete len:80 (-) Transcript_17911:285-524(-)